MVKIMFGIVLGAISFGFYMLIRNHLVYSERVRVNKACYEKAVKENLGEEAWDEYFKYTYDEMMWQFWRPVSSFYKDIK